MASVTLFPSRVFGGDFVDIEIPDDDDDGKVLMWNKNLPMAVWKTLTEVAAYGYTPSLDFSDARNSMYAPLVTGT